MTVAKIVDRVEGAVITAETSDRVVDVVRLLAERRIGCVPIVEGDRVAGIFSERDVIYGLAKRGAALLDLPVGEVMTHPAITIEKDTPVLSALSMMTRRRIRHLPVVQGDRLVGFVSIGDLVKYRIDHIEAEAEAMREYIQSV